MSHPYQSEYPSDISVDPEVVKFFEDFYAISDTPGADDRYIDQFTEDATCIMGPKRAKGTAEITPMRRGMWAAVASRRHAVPRIFPFGNDARDFMLYGTVDLTLRDGGAAHLEWAARASLQRSPADGKWRMRHYHVYLDTGAAAQK